MPINSFLLRPNPQKIEHCYYLDVAILVVQPLNLRPLEHYNGPLMGTATSIRAFRVTF